MKTNVFLNIGIRIIILFLLGMMFSFLPNELRGFFGDIPHICKDSYCSHSGIDDSFDWGARHYWYFWMMICLFILSLINFIVSVCNLLIKEYPKTFS